MVKHQAPCDPGPSAWNCLLPAQTPRAALHEDRVVDWLVIGAGFAGLSAARRLAQLHPNDQVVVLDATEVAEGPAGRNSGFMIDVPHDLSASDYAGNTEHDERDIRLNRAGINYALSAADEYEMDEESIVLSGKINGAVSVRGQSHNEAYAKHLDRLGEAYTRLNADEMKAITGTDSYIDGLYSPGTAMIQPAKYIRALAGGVEGGTVTIYENSPVLNLVREGTGWKAKTPKGSVQAGRVILCVNGHLANFGFHQRALMHVFTYASMTRALSADEVKRLGGDSRWAITPADALGTTVRRISGSGGERIIIRNRATFDASLSVSERRLVDVAKQHDRSYHARFPMLSDVPMEYRWGGRLCLTRNQVSVFGEIDQHLYSACCQNGLGTAKGTISGCLAAELASEQTSDLLQDQMTGNEPVKLPPEPVASIAANAVLRWGEFRAGDEL